MARRSISANAEHHYMIHPPHPGPSEYSTGPDNTENENRSTRITRIYGSPQVSGRSQSKRVRVLPVFDWRSRGAHHHAVIGVQGMLVANCSIRIGARVSWGPTSHPNNNKTGRVRKLYSARFCELGDCLRDHEMGLLRTLPQHSLLFPPRAI